MSMIGGMLVIPKREALRAEGVRFEIVDNAVVTVAPDQGHPSNLSRERNQRLIQRRNPA